MKSSRIWILIVFIAALAAAWWSFKNQLTPGYLIMQESWLRQQIADSPIAMFAIGLTIYTVASLVPGTTGKAIAFGWLFGFWEGLLLVNFGLTFAALIAFMVIRYGLREAVHQKYGEHIARVDAALRRDGAFYLLTLRLIHAPYTLTNYTAGATAVPATTFWWTTQLGLIPGNIAFVLAGAQLPALEELVQHGPLEVVNLPLLIGLSLIAIIPVGTRWLLRQRADQEDVSGE